MAKDGVASEELAAIIDIVQKYYAGNKPGGMSLLLWSYVIAGKYMGYGDAEIIEKVREAAKHPEAIAMANRFKERKDEADNAGWVKPGFKGTGGGDSGGGNPGGSRKVH